MTTDPFSTATAMLAALERREVSSVELLEMHRERYERFNPELNAIVVPTFEAAEEAARAADDARARGEKLGPLHGLPMTTKESSAMAGLPQSAGLEIFADFRAPETSLLMQRVLDAGALIMGKTNIPTALSDWQADSPVYGRTVNPWDHSRTPGGSTGGGSAALAAGLTPLEIGSDIGGSIRVPAAYCGLYGHRPSETLVPRSGSFPPSSNPNPVATMGVQGPLARSAEDLELLLDVISGPEPGEEQWRIDLPPARGESLAGLRVGLLAPVPWMPVDDEIAAALERTGELASRAGAVVNVVEPPFDFQDMTAKYVSLLSIMMGSAQPPEERERRIARLKADQTWQSDASAAGLSATIRDLFAIMGAREMVRRAWRGFFQDWDVLVAPITLIPAFQHMEQPPEERTVQVNGQTVPYFLMIAPPALATFAGQGATAFPAGLHSSGLPIGLQAIGPYLEDRTPIRFAQLMAEHLGGFVAPARYAAAEAVARPA